MPFIQRLNKRWLFLCSYSSTPQWISDVITYEHYYILTFYGNYAGAICFSTMAGEVEVEALAINKRYQNKNLGTFAMSLVEKFAREKGYRYLTLGSYSSYDAMGFYKKLGFKVIDKGNDEVGTYWEFLKMLK